MKKIALVTGGMGGIGSAICKALADGGFNVVATYSKAGRELQWLADMKASGYLFSAYECDVTDYDACVRMAARINEEIGPVDVLVNNAGITRDATFKRMGKLDWDSVISTNLNSLFNVSKQFVDAMVE
ncbi:MAG: SDR family NAD(P)-dependent oxidoreductase, partial [Iodobacter sp.]